MDIIGSALAALLFIAGMSRVREPTRQAVNAVLAAGAAGAYLSGGGFGIWELPFAAIAGVVAYYGLRSYGFIGIAWFMHAAWDLAHHRYGNPIWPFMESSSLGCAVFDAIIGAWFLALHRRAGSDVRPFSAPAHPATQ